MQGFILPDITATKKCTLILGSTSNFQIFIIYMYFGQTTHLLFLIKNWENKI